MSSTAATSTTKKPPGSAKIKDIVMVGIGGLEVVSPPLQLRTVLGSCVGIALYDPVKKVAGLAHSILPEGTEEAAELGKFADQAVDNLLVKMLAEGALKGNIQAKLIGGAQMFGKGNNTKLGERNVESARHRLECHHVTILAEHVGGTKGRKMRLDPKTGEVTVELIGQKAEVI